MNPAPCAQHATTGIGLLSGRLLPLLETHACLVLSGPREVGKRTLAKALAADSGLSFHHLDASLDADRAILQGSSSPLLTSVGRVIVIEEYEQFPEVLGTVRKEISRNGIDRSMLGRMIFVAGRKPAQRCLASDALGTNVASCVINPMSLPDFISAMTATIQTTEYALESVAAAEPMVEPPNIEEIAHRHWLRGGFPRSLHAGSNLESMSWRTAYLERLLARGCLELDPSLGPTELRRRMSRIALLSSKISDYDNLDRLLLNYLADIHLLRRLPAWHNNGLSGLEKRPRYYLRDSGLLHAWFKVQNITELHAKQLTGASWEGYCIEQILSCRRVDNASYFRRADRDEVDLVLPLSEARTVLCEFGYGKTSPSPNTLKAKATIGARELYVINNGTEARQTADYTALPLTDFLKFLLAS